VSLPETSSVIPPDGVFGERTLMGNLTAHVSNIDLTDEKLPVITMIPSTRSKVPKRVANRKLIDVEP
jgi:hypothetical protein